MTEKEILSHYNVNLELFDDDLEHEAFYINSLRTIFISSKLTGIDRRKALLHELGHIKHNPNNLHRNRELYEVQANRNMIHHLLKAELDEHGSESFNYITFMEKYKLKTIADETMVKEEFYNLVGII
ncbi:ImmA/IrrE family metallo-endopeptidase [Streptococcus pluranimalium]|uniref:ImmA/IrrE family metallo-endopeptidase n=1 Tax=Streptococcus pluranimalium TaxID=82348 RepID=UPI003F6626CA